MTPGSTTSAANRRHETPGVYNLRDTGGYRAGTRTSRWGKLLRSDALHRLDASGRDLLGELGVAHIVDLRGADELRTAPSSLDGLAVQVHHLPVFDDAAPASRAGLQVGLAPIYDHMVDERGANLADAIRVIALAGDDEAVLVHCTAGKDRTGLVVAFALSAAGVDRDEVVADYAQTAANLQGEWADAMLAGFRDSGAELTPEVVELVTASPAPVLAALLERVDREHGSVRAYLAAHGMTEDELDRLTAALVR
ncbi:tyrosine-protein phosphatase [Microbacterium capsulatum]|uniref:Tyrosine-protein phosphatase n=1 Tax=Microbacterium capsulatum TaxID=3041921 RepID=A0ABU0XHL2_9MICO|nr:tyrosine-protein phosphatase [Microbacterium sp. ASV81]MDQ4214617.1 tyrosine-protein phosphatase [Microbacterium sp. ASV81]